MLQERNQRSGNRGNLLWRDVHQVDIRRRNNGEVGILTALHHFADEGAIVVQRGITLTDDVLSLLLGCQIYNLIIIKVGNTSLNLTIRCLNKAQFIYLGIDTERRDQADVRAFGALNRTETAVVGIVYVTHLEASTLTRQTARTQSGETTFVSHLGQRVCLVHELRQRIGAKERVNDARDSLGVNQIHRREHFIIANVHALTDGTAHTG